MAAVSDLWHDLEVGPEVFETTPIDATGWETKLIHSVPNASLAQRGIFAKGDLTYASFTTLKLLENYSDLVVRTAVSLVPQLTAAVAKSDPSARVVSAVGIEPKLWRKWDASPPPALRSFSNKLKATLDATEILFPGADIDIFLMVKSLRLDLCYEVTAEFICLLGSSQNIAKVERYHSFRYLNGRDLTGFMDGTRQPDHHLRALADEITLHPGEDSGVLPTHAGGSYAYVGRFVHNLDKFHKLDDSEKSLLVGRTYKSLQSLATLARGFNADTSARIENPILPNAPPSAHINRAYGVMYRQAMPYVAHEDVGLYFVAFTRYLEEIDSALDRMSGRVDGVVDRLLDVSKNVASAYVYVPSLPELRELRKRPASA